MFLLVALILSLIIGLARGGRFGSLGHIRFVHGWLFAIALILQVLIFSSWWAIDPRHNLWTPWLYVGSMLLLLAGVLCNRHLPGIPLLGLGLLCNIVVIIANGGHMPASGDALNWAGFLPYDETVAPSSLTNLTITQEGTRLWWLGDVFAIPRNLPLANVFSVGDIMIALGGFWFVQRTMNKSSDWSTC